MDFFVKPIRVVLVDSSSLSLKAIERAIAENGAFEIVGRATNGRAGLALIDSLRPDVAACSTALSLLSATELVAETMSRFATPILVLQAPAESASAQSASAETMAMLAAGAIDWSVKPAPDQADEFLIKLVRTSRVKVLTRHRKTAETPNQPRATIDISRRVQTPVSQPIREPNVRAANECSDKTPELIAIGASTGGPPVLLELLRDLHPQRVPPILCVQHIAHGFLVEMVAWLRAQCRVEIAIAAGGEIVRAGTVYFSAEDRHLEISGGGRLSLSKAAPIAGHRPAVDVTFASVARSYGPRALALLLTGMGADGALGMQQIRESNGAMWAQKPASCVVAGMPGKAIELGAAQFVLTPTEMRARLLHL